ncbi:MAG: alpha/beta fold hydrolase [Enterobacteriaceae bacterium]
MDINYKVLGKGNYNIVLIHGFGVNSYIWKSMVKNLVNYFSVCLIDLPGYNNTSYTFCKNYFDNLVYNIFKLVNKPSIWIGWSFGGLIATKIVYLWPEYSISLITISSSPCFKSKKSWPGISSLKFSDFTRSIKKNKVDSLKKFFIFKVIGINFYKTFRNLNINLFIFPIPNTKILLNEIKIIHNLDLRKEITEINVPYLRIYGDSDLLVPYRISKIIDVLCPKSKSFVIYNSSHAIFFNNLSKLFKIIFNFLTLLMINR